jgi:MFS family permease
LNAILPEVLTVLRVATNDLLRTGGLVIFFSGLALALASLTGPRLAGQINERRSIQRGLIISSVLILILPFAPTLWTFLIVRCFQVAVLGPPLVLAMTCATQRGGQTLGLANSARVAAGVFGPLVATACASRMPLPLVFGSVTVIGLITAVVAWDRWGSSGVQRPPKQSIDYM